MAFHKLLFVKNVAYTLKGLVDLLGVYAIRHCSEENIDNIIALADIRMYEDKKKIKNE